MQSLARARYTVHLNFLHAAVGARSQLLARGLYLGKYKPLQFGVTLECLSSPVRHSSSNQFVGGARILHVFLKHARKRALFDMNVFIQSEFRRGLVEASLPSLPNSVL